MEALSEEFRAGLPWELLYADDLALIAESIRDLERQYVTQKRDNGSKGPSCQCKKDKGVGLQPGP